LEEEKATLEEMVESRDELLMEIARETGLDNLLPHHHLQCPLLWCLRRSMKMALWR
jgi:hypothetical protein